MASPNRLIAVNHCNDWIKSSQNKIGPQYYYELLFVYLVELLHG